MMRMMRRMLLKKGDAMTQDDRDLLAAYDTPVDFTDVSALAPASKGLRACRLQHGRAEPVYEKQRGRAAKGALT